MQTYKVHLGEPKLYKPDHREIGRISNRMLKSYQELTLEQIATEVACNGKTIVSGHFSGSGLKQQLCNLHEFSIFMLDFDNDKEVPYSLNNILNREFVQAFGAFYYHTFSTNSERPRFRIVFVSNFPMHTELEVKHVYQRLFQYFPEADKKVGQPNRMFFGSTSGYQEINFENRLTLEQFGYFHDKKEPVEQKALLKNVRKEREHEANSISSMRERTQKKSAERKAQRKVSNNPKKLNQATLSEVEEIENVEKIKEQEKLNLLRKQAGKELFALPETLETKQEDNVENKTKQAELVKNTEEFENKEKINKTDTLPDMFDFGYGQEQPTKEDIKHLIESERDSESDIENNIEDGFEDFFEEFMEEQGFEEDNFLDFDNSDDVDLLDKLIQKIEEEKHTDKVIEKESEEESEKIEEKSTINSNKSNKSKSKPNRSVSKEEIYRAEPKIIDYRTGDSSNEDNSEESEKDYSESVFYYKKVLDILNKKDFTVQEPVDYESLQQDFRTVIPENLSPAEYKQLKEATGSYVDVKGMLDKQSGTDKQSKVFTNTDTEETIPETFTRDKKVKPVDERIPQELLDELAVYQLLKLGYFEEVKKRWLKYSLGTVSSDVQFLSYFARLNMVELLGLPKTNPFSSIFHYDRHPSASVICPDNHKVYMYKCFNDGKFMGDVFEVVKELLQLDTKKEAIELLRELTSTVIEYDPSDRHSRQYFGVVRLLEALDGNYMSGQLSDLLAYISDEDKVRVKVLYKLYLSNIFYVEETGEFEYYTYMSNKRITKEFNATSSEDALSERKVWNLLSVLIVSELLEKVPFSKTTQSTQRYFNIRKESLKDKRVRYSNVQTIPIIEDNELLYANNQCKRLLDLNLSQRSLRYETVSLHFSEEQAIKYFPQSFVSNSGKVMSAQSDTNKHLSIQNEWYLKTIIDTINQEMSTKGYCFEKDIISVLYKQHGVKSTRASDLLRDFRTYIMQQTGLDNKTVTNALKIQLKVTENYQRSRLYFK